MHRQPHTENNTGASSPAQPDLPSDEILEQTLRDQLLPCRRSEDPGRVNLVDQLASAITQIGIVDRVAAPHGVIVQPLRDANGHPVGEDLQLFITRSFAHRLHIAAQDNIQAARDDFGQVLIAATVANITRAARQTDMSPHDIAQGAQALQHSLSALNAIHDDSTRSPGARIHRLPLP